MEHDILALHQLVSHCVTDHNHSNWYDPEFEAESLKLDKILRSHEKKLEREREEREIVIPRLPKKCTHCSEVSNH